MGAGLAGAAAAPLTSPPPPARAQLLQLWEKNGYFDDSIIQQLQSPALGLGQYQVRAVLPAEALSDPQRRLSSAQRVPWPLALLLYGAVACTLPEGSRVLSSGHPSPGRPRSSASIRPWCSRCSWPSSSRSRASRRSTMSLSAAWPSSSRSSFRRWRPRSRPRRHQRPHHPPRPPPQPCPPPPSRVSGSPTLGGSEPALRVLACEPRGGAGLGGSRFLDQRGCASVPGNTARDTAAPRDRRSRFRVRWGQGAWCRPHRDQGHRSGGMLEVRTSAWVVGWRPHSASCCPSSDCLSRRR